MRPGGQGWGYLILWFSLAVAVAAMITLSLAWRSGDAHLVILLMTGAVGSASTSLIVIVGMALGARPPDGAGPSMVPDWGAVVGFALAVIASSGAWWAFAVGIRRRRKQRPALGDTAQEPQHG